MNLLNNKITVIFSFAFIVLFLGCETQNDENNKISETEDYVKLAKEFEDGYIQELKELPKKIENGTALKLTENEMAKIAEDHGFDSQKIKEERSEVLYIAKQYGIPEKDVELDKYFFINPINGEINDESFYHKMFAFIKYQKEQVAPKLGRNDN